MSLSLALEIARGSLMANSTASSVVSRNIANVDNPNAGRKYVSTISTALGVKLSGISNAVSSSLLESVISSESKFNELNAVTTALTRMSGVLNDPELEISPAAVMSDLQAALSAAAAEPYNETLLQAVVSSANDMATSLQDAATLVAQVRNDANSDLAKAAKQLEALLQDFESTNNAIVSGSFAGRDVTDSIDRRNALLRDISSLIDVNPTTRGNNDMVLFTANGTTLFETVPRKIGYTAGGALAPGLPGNAFTIDGVPFTGTSSAQLGGKVGGLLKVRDDIGITFGRQIDEIARGLIEAFAETDQSAVPGLPAIAGLFTYAGGPGLPLNGFVSDGLALLIQVNPNVDPKQGGDLALIRDGAIGAPGNPAYNYNSGGEAGFSGRLRELAAMLSESQTFASDTGLGTSMSVLSLASASGGWLEGRRSDASTRLEDRQVLGERALGAWQGQIGVNLDEEMASLMALERSYQASARLIATVDKMFAALLDAAR
jgi:flagellar hook-associated protein 1 FlgK